MPFRGFMGEKAGVNKSWAAQHPRNEKMKIIWQVEPQDIEKVRNFLSLHENDPFVQQRIERNPSDVKPEITKEAFWFVMVSCMLTTQQRSGPNSAVTRFTKTRPFPLNYQSCVSSGDPRAFTQKVISNFGGLRFSNRLSSQIETNLHLFKQGLWSETFAMLNKLCSTQTLQSERKVANFINHHFTGFGPKQSRNLLQTLGLTKYEIPIDSRITKWLNRFGFPVKLSANALSDANYYKFISEGFQYLCAQSSVYPCVLDAAIFTSFDKGGWSKENVIW